MIRHESCTTYILSIYLLLNFQSCLHMGHCCWGCECSHLTMQWMWKQWEQAPHTRGQSSPGSLQSGQQLSKGMRQIPQLSSLATHRQVATPVQPTQYVKIGYVNHPNRNEGCWFDRLSVLYLLLTVTFISRNLHTASKLN